ncbi:MAG: hypothetical protein FWE12_03905 [Oscillospiraceae bacterium]|nr:hypothetical protein [Oscillospiraceae bacterium]
MLFRKNIDPSCAYCKHGSQLSYDKVACMKRGVVPLYGSCRKFSYDPLKRVPERPRKFHPSDSGETFHL